MKWNFTLKTKPMKDNTRRNKKLKTTTFFKNLDQLQKIYLQNKQTKNPRLRHFYKILPSLQNIDKFYLTQTDPKKEANRRNSSTYFLKMVFPSLFTPKADKGNTIRRKEQIRGEKPYDYLTRCTKICNKIQSPII